MKVHKIFDRNPDMLEFFRKLAKTWTEDPYFPEIIKETKSQLKIQEETMAKAKKNAKRKTIKKAKKRK